MKSFSVYHCFLVLAVSMIGVTCGEAMAYNIFGQSGIQGKIRSSATKSLPNMKLKIVNVTVNVTEMKD